MKLFIQRSYRRPARTLGFALALWSIAWSSAHADEKRALMIGGGPNPRSNQVAIESNLRYMLRLLPTDVRRTVLFADGDTKAETVLFEDQAKELKPGERIIALLLEGRGSAHPSTLKFRAPSLTQLDGPSRRSEIESAFGKLAAQNPTESPLLLYFTGHGSPNRNRNLDNNVYDLWQESGLSVQDLASQIAKLPPEQALTLVMVQCYSGAFGNLLFENGNPKGTLIERDIAGFFATVKERVAAGCTPALDESEYHDFTSYFFAALTGTDRVGRRVRGADYNHDGQVTMDEAFCYALIHDASIDIPICTTDVYLRRVITTPDEELFKNPYSQVRGWATAAQRTALEELSKKLKLSGDDRGQTAYAKFINAATGPQQGGNPGAAARRAFNSAREEDRRFLFQRWPELNDKNGAGYDKAHTEAVEMAERQVKEGKYKALLDAEAAMDTADDNDYKLELSEALQTRFVRLYKSVVLSHMVHVGNDAVTRQKLDRLIAAESRPLFGNTKVASRTINHFDTP